MTIYDFGTIVLVNFPQTNLKKGPKRPALVIYDEGDEDVILARITSQPHAGKNECAAIKNILQDMFKP